MIGRTASDRDYPARWAGFQRLSKRQRGRKILRGNPFSGFTRFLQHKRHKTPHKNQYTTTAKRDKHWVSKLPPSGQNLTRRVPQQNTRDMFKCPAPLCIITQSPPHKPTASPTFTWPKNPENHSKNKNEKTKSRHSAPKQITA